MITTNRNTQRKQTLIFSLLAFFFVLPAAIVFAQSGGSHSAERKLITRVAPEYPEALRKNFIGGAVRLEVTVSPNGNVDNAQILGGNPILGQAAMKAIKQWKYAPASTWDKLVVRVDFDPRVN
ncbi:MAG TPA: energy transducer TonB [Terriglobales bacterium]|nr:energy transducer TonB [Terriglobales bacterium]